MKKKLKLKSGDEDIFLGKVRSYFWFDKKGLNEIV